MEADSEETTREPRAFLGTDLGKKDSPRSEGIRKKRMPRVLLTPWCRFGLGVWSILVADDQFGLLFWPLHAGSEYKHGPRKPMYVADENSEG